MALCPWCKVEVGELPPTSPCPKCKRVGTSHPWLKSNAPPPLASGMFGMGVELEQRGPGSSPPRSASPAPFVLDTSADAGLELDLGVPKQQLVPVRTASPVAYAKTAVAVERARIPSFEGELDLGAPASAPPASGPRTSSPAMPAVVPPPPQSGRSVLDDHDDLMAGGGDLALDLDVSGGGALPVGLSQPRISTSSPSLPLPSGPPSTTSGSFASVSAVSTPPSDEIDPFEARALADFGEPPENPLLTPLYALRVLRRRGELTRQLAFKREEAARARQKAEDAMVAFGERMRPAAEQAQSRNLEAVRAAEELLRSRDSGLAGEMDTHRAELAKVDERLKVVEAELAAAQAEERRIAEEHARASEVKQRNVAKMKRAEIEIRNATQLLESAKGAQQ